MERIPLPPKPMNAIASRYVRDAKQGLRGVWVMYSGAEWIVRKPLQRNAQSFPTKKLAVAFAREQARRTQGAVFIHTKSGELAK